MGDLKGSVFDEEEVRKGINCGTITTENRKYQDVNVDRIEMMM